MMNFLENVLRQCGVPESLTQTGSRLAAVILVLVLAVIADLIVRRWISRALTRLVEKSAFKWDDPLAERRVFARLANLAPVLVVYLFAGAMFPDAPVLRDAVQDFAFAVLVILAVLLLYAFINALLDFYESFEVSRQIPLKGIAQVLKIVLFLAAMISVISLLTGKSPVVLLSGIGAMTAVLMLIFKDAILGFVAGIQLMANNMVSRGDWVEMPSHGADGDVIDISLTTVKVQNWDKTISTIPTYAMISSSFKNWRGMQESGGRRIKRAINIDLSTIRFCDEAMLDRFSKMQFITEYLRQKSDEVQKYNVETHADPANLLNGRRLTNIGTFRAYVVAYLKNHPAISDSMTFLVRQLAPGEHGLPIEIYVFSTDKVWANYEAIQADIFDHILAAVPEFDLRVFQQPSGHDLRMLGNCSQGAATGAPN